MTEASATSYGIIDLQHLGRRESIAACVLDTADGLLVVDPGPASTLQQLRDGLTALRRSAGEITGLLLTHIHLDHAGGAGVLAREHPGLEVFVHASGAPHVIDPSKLLASATRLYGSRMDQLWGEVAPVPAERVRVLHGGEHLRLGGREFEVLYTPGHAGHHVTYFEPASRVAFVGDTAGLRTPGIPCVLPVTPPPEFDLEAWLDSISRIRALHPAEIVLTHFGPSSEPDRHLEELAAGLIQWAAFAREILETEASDAERIAAFTARLEQWIEGRVPPEAVRRFIAGAGPDACWHGLARYWNRRIPART